MRAFRWYSIDEFRRNELIKKGEIAPDSGYKYEDDSVKTLYEYHVDEHLTFQKECEHLQFGGNLSVRMPPDEKKVMMMGQDEAIMRRNIFLLLAWSMPDGARPLIPKDEGYGLMTISAFTCRELGFGFTVPSNVLKEVNALRQGTKYSEESAAEEIHGSVFKKELTHTPFVRELEYGKNKNGYWTYDHMVVQLEDCVDILTYMYPDFEFIFFLDHSNGHDRMRPNGLNINRINIKHGGSQPIMRDSEPLTSNLFGPFHTKDSPLQPGDIQKMQYVADDEGPCYFLPSERINCKYDIDTGKTREVEYTKAKLITLLKESGVNDPCGNKEKLQDLATARGLPLKYTKKVIKEGWHMKPKGALQILFKQGWIDPHNITRYSAKGKEGSDGCVEFSIDQLMEKQDDFTSELTLLQYHTNLMGVRLERSPKCHPEIAGEGVEYGWALSKVEYRRLPIARKKSKDGFLKLVRHCMDNKSILNLERMRACSRRAHQYMLLYKTVEMLNLDEANGTVDSPVLNKHSILEGSI